jgi:hypothetical protein
MSVLTANTHDRVLRILEMIDRLPNVEFIQKTGGGWNASGDNVQEAIDALRADARAIRCSAWAIEITYDGEDAQSRVEPPLHAVGRRVSF